MSQDLKEETGLERKHHDTRYLRWDLSQGLGPKTEESNRFEGTRTPEMGKLGVRLYKEVRL